MFKVFCVVSWMQYLDLVSPFGIEQFTSFDNYIETGAVFLRLRMKKTSNS